MLRYFFSGFKQFALGRSPGLPGRGALYLVAVCLFSLADGLVGEGPAGRCVASVFAYRDPALTHPPSFKFDGVDEPPYSLRSLGEFEKGFRWS